MSTKADEMDRKITDATRQMVYEHIRETEVAIARPTSGADIVGLDAQLPQNDEHVDVAKVRADAESWLKTYPIGADALPSDEWDWLNGRCHPGIVIALCEKIAALEASLGQIIDRHMDERARRMSAEERLKDAAQ